MISNISFWKTVQEVLNNDLSVILLIVLESVGSSPGRHGFVMVVLPDGKLLGSIGGGIMEHKLVEYAKTLMEKGSFEPILKKQIHRSEGIDRSGMICSGQQSVAFYHVDKSNKGLIAKILKYLENEESIQLICSESELSLLSVLDDDFVSILSENRWAIAIPLFQHEQVYIIGAGHVGLALSRVMFQLGFHVHLFDHRTDLNTFISNTHIHTKQVVDYDKIDSWIPEFQNTYVVIATFGYRYDKICLERLAGKAFRYIGVMGSTAKMKRLLNELEKDGVPKEDLASIHTPIGLRINSQTPEEIAISIAAQIIKEKNK